MVLAYTDHWSTQFVTAAASVFHSLTNTEIRSNEVTVTNRSRVTTAGYYKIEQFKVF